MPRARWLRRRQCRFGRDRFDPGERRSAAIAARPRRASLRQERRLVEGGVTREKINAMCWMKYETGRKDMPVDKRADLVNACVVQTLKEHPV